ncbi:5711_t:CDS:1, partial [Funneliformis caledonium]
EKIEEEIDETEIEEIKRRILRGRIRGIRREREREKEVLRGRPKGRLRGIRREKLRGREKPNRIRE